VGFDNVGKPSVLENILYHHVGNVAEEWAIEKMNETETYNKQGQH
jgi:hypothetical protein